MLPTKHTRGCNSKVRGLSPDGSMTFVTRSGMSIVLLVLECSSPYHTTADKKDQDKRKLLVESLFARIGLFDQFQIHYGDRINTEIAREISEVETIWVQAYGNKMNDFIHFHMVLLNELKISATQIRASLFDQKHLPLSCSRCVMDVSFPRPVVETAGKRIIERDTLQRFLTAIACLRQTIDRTCGKIDEIDKNIRSLSPISKNPRVDLFRNFITSEREFLLERDGQ